MKLIYQINDMKHDVKLVSQMVNYYDYYSTSLPCDMPH